MKLVRVTSEWHIYDVSAPNCNVRGIYTVCMFTYLHYIYGVRVL